MELDVHFLISHFVLKRHTIEQFLKSVACTSKVFLLITPLVPLLLILNFCSKDLTHEETWVGNGPNYCKSPKLIMEKARINASELLNEVKVLYENDSSIRIGSNDECCWKYSDDRFYGSCHTFSLPLELRPKSVSRLRFFMKANVNWMVHSKGTFESLKERDVISFNASYLNLQAYATDYEVYEMLDVDGKKCEDDESYHRDDCYDSVVFKESMATLNCTWPLLRNKDHICMDQDKAKDARKIAMDYFKKRKDSNCASSCSYVKASYQLRQDKKTQGKEIRFMFPESINVQTAFYVYKELSLIAEVGGYVGLFLGWSVFGITDLLNKLFESFKRKLTYNPDA